MRTIQPHGFSQRHPTFAMVCLAGLLALSACVPDKDQAVQSATEAYCQKAEECDWTDDVADCEDATEEVFDGLWSNDDCEEDGLDREGWNNCLEAIDNLNCEDVTRGLSSLGACDSSDVCL